jgi:hypothetical protein
MRARLETSSRPAPRYVNETLGRDGRPGPALVGDGALSITKETGQTADTIITENIVKMWARLRPGSHSRAIWAANPTTFPQLATLSIAIGTGGTVVSLLQPSGIAGGPATSILGRPLTSRAPSGARKRGTSASSTPCCTSWATGSRSSWTPPAYPVSVRRNGLPRTGPFRRPTGALFGPDSGQRRHVRLAGKDRGACVIDPHLPPGGRLRPLPSPGSNCDCGITYGL